MLDDSLTIENFTLSDLIAIIAIVISIFAVITTAIGWIVTHRMALTAQERLLDYQLSNQARIDINDAIRDYQDWLVEIRTKIDSLESEFQVNKSGLSVVFAPRDQLSNLFISDRRALTWLQRLEDYQILFPQITTSMKQLLHRNGEITENLNKLLNSLDKDEQLHEYAVAEAQNSCHSIFDMMALTVDLQRHLQNICLGQIKKVKIPERLPIARNSVQLLADKKGNLYVKVVENPLEPRKK